MHAWVEALVRNSDCSLELPGYGELATLLSIDIHDAHSIRLEVLGICTWHHSILGGNGALRPVHVNSPSP